MDNKVYFRRKILGIVLLMVAVTGCLYIAGKINAGAAGTQNAYMKFVEFDPYASTGSEANPFIILEIVPYRGMGQIGYIVGGQEPVNIALSTYANPLWGPVDSVAKGAFSVTEKSSLDETDNINEWSFIASGNKWVPSNNWCFENNEVFKRRILHLEEDELSNYHVRVVTITPDELNKNVEKYTKYYDLNDNGRNNKVLLTQDEDGEIDLIANADLISISPKAHAGTSTLVNLWEAYGRDISGRTSSPDRYNKTFGDNDISWQTAMELFMKIGLVTDRAACIYDITSITAPPETAKSVRGPISTETCSGYSNNIYKLCLMLRQQDPVRLYNNYLYTGGQALATGITETVLSGRTTGILKDAALPLDAQIYWGEYTFLPLYPDGTGPAYIAEGVYKNYLNDNDILVAWIAGSCHDSVIRNTYSYNGTSSVVQYFLETGSLQDDTHTSYDYNADFFGYLEAAAGERPSAASPLQAVEYILNMCGSQRYTDKELYILELQPCNDFSLSEQRLHQLLPGITGALHIDYQTTAEFIGRMEDLNCTYDLIYIGTNTGTMNTDSMGITRYNDPVLDGLIYLHVGDRLVGYDNLKGILKEDGNIVKAVDYIDFASVSGNYGQTVLKGLSSLSMLQAADFYRYPGNDITKVKQEKLQEYADAGLVLLLEEGLYECNAGIIDDSSNLYDFLYKNREKESVINMKDLLNPLSAGDTADKIMDILIKDKLDVAMHTSPVAYREEESLSRIADRTLNFEFTIEAETGSSSIDTYDWCIYVDFNADGKNEPCEVIDSGQEAAGSMIVSSKTLDKEYADVVPWRLSVAKTGRPIIRTEVSGLAAFMPVPQNNVEALKNQIDVLQITSNNSTINLEALMEPEPGRTSLFYQYTRELKDFNVNIRTIAVSGFLSMYTGSGNAYIQDKHEETDKLFFYKNGVKKSYDMLIFGFGDCYSDINNDNGALDNITAFIDSGRSVMFTHDTTSFVNLTQSEYNSYRQGLSYWGYGINRYLRSRLGLDRFGAVSEAGDDTPYDTASMPGQAYHNMYLPKSLTKGGTAYPEIQGLTYAALIAYSNPGSISNGYNPFSNDIYSANKAYPPFSTDDSRVIKGTAVERFKTRYVTKVNEGQITSYPYHIPDSFMVGETHTQYYQLNMEDPGVVVWFCLSDSASGDGPYSTSPNDVRNNYYIYSKGNIMYTVVGHSAIDAVIEEGEAGIYDEYEVKLFINSMITSWQAGVTAPDVCITNTDAVLNSLEEYIMYDNPDAPDGADKKISFIAEDTNLSTTWLVIRIYCYDEEGNPVLLNPVVVKKEDESLAELYSHEGREEGYIVEPGKEYSFHLPLDSLTAFRNHGKDVFDIKVTNEEYNLSRTRRGVIYGRQLFDLD